jgi:hypothetical protein
MSPEVWLSDVDGARLVAGEEPEPPAPDPIDENGLPTYRTYTVKGKNRIVDKTVVGEDVSDTLVSVAEQYGVDWFSLFQLNRGLLGGNPAALQVGMVLVIPNEGLR